METIDHNSVTNQDIKRKFVDREVICLFSYPMEACLRAGAYDMDGMPQYDEIENAYTYPEYRGKYADFDGGTEDERNEEIERLVELREELENTDEYNDVGKEIDQLNIEVMALEELESEPQEIFEWWIVTDHLYDKLKEKGEPVIEWQNLSIWGRTTTGQAILLDGVISDICEEMEILEGQKYSWA